MMEMRGVNSATIDLSIFSLQLSTKLLLADAECPRLPSNLQQQR